MQWLYSFFFINLFIYLFLAVLGLRFCARAFSSCGKWGPLFIAVHGPFTVAASFVAAHRLQMRRLSSCGSRAQWLRGMWDPPRPGLKPVSPALAGRFSTTAPPGKPLLFFFKSQNREYSEINHLSLVPANMVQDQSWRLFCPSSITRSSLPTLRQQFCGSGLFCPRGNQDLHH